MKILNSSKAIAAVTTAFFVASLLWLMNTERVNNSLEAGLQKEKLQSEELLSEKLMLEKDLDRMKHQLSTLQGKNNTLDDIVRNTSAKLEAQETEFNRLKKDNATLSRIKKQRQEFIALQSALENELQLLKASYAELEEKNEALNSMVLSLQERNKTLTDDLNRAMFATVDQSQIQAFKGKSERLTVRAKKTNKLAATFEVSSNLRNLSYRIIDPKGNVLTQKDGMIASTITPSDNIYTVSTDAEVAGNKSQKAEVVYIPKNKLKSGTYRIEILNENLYVASLKVKLK
jgi:DNA repair exonuclease SbcCD ATPase subunit